MCVDGNYGSMPNYIPSSFNPNVWVDGERYNERHEVLEPPNDVDRYESKFEDNYSQLRDFYRTLTRPERARLYDNIAADLRLCKDFIQKRALQEFGKVDPEYEQGVRRAILNASGSF